MTRAMTRAIKHKDVLIQQIAKAFSQELLIQLGGATVREIVELNAADADENCCHSHDFCDANEVMGIAFEKVMRRQPLEEGFIQSDCDLMGAAWYVAKAAKFEIK